MLIDPPALLAGAKKLDWEPQNRWTGDRGIHGFLGTGPTKAEHLVQPSPSSIPCLQIFFIWFNHMSMALTFVSLCDFLFLFHYILFPSITLCLYLHILMSVSLLFVPFHFYFSSSAPTPSSTSAQWGQIGGMKDNFFFGRFLLWNHYFLF